MMHVVQCMMYSISRPIYDNDTCFFLYVKWLPTPCLIHDNSDISGVIHVRLKWIDESTNASKHRCNLEVTTKTSKDAIRKIGTSSTPRKINKDTKHDGL